MNRVYLVMESYCGDPWYVVRCFKEYEMAEDFIKDILINSDGTSNYMISPQNVNLYMSSSSSSRSKNEK